MPWRAARPLTAAALVLIGSISMVRTGPAAVDAPPPAAVPWPPPVAPSGEEDAAPFTPPSGAAASRQGALPAGPARLVADLQTDLFPGSTSGEQDVLVAEGAAYFKAVADLPVRRGQIWRSDGTRDGTVLLHEFSDVDATGMIEIDGVVLFGGTTWDTGAELWRTDGTQEGTALAADLVPGSGSSSPRRFVRLGDAVYFLTSEEPSRGLGRLYRTDGTAAGTRCIYPCGDLPAGIPSSSSLVVMDGAIYFTHTAGPASELRRSDGTPEGTSLVRAFSLGPIRMTAAADRLFFTADDGLHGLEPWSSDGVAGGAGTVLARDIRPGRFGSMDLSTSVTLGSGVIFSANDGVRGLELWITDGTAAGTRLLRDINPGAGGGFPHHFTVAGAEVWFAAGTGPYGRDLWRTDGTEAGTIRVHTITPEAAGLADVPAMAEAAGRLFFAGWDAAHGWEPWASDGTTAGTLLVADLRPGAASSLLPADLPRLAPGPGGRLLLFADDGEHGREPWITDGTPEGTALLRDANPVGGTAGSSPRGLAATGPLLQFMTADPEAIWATDGTAEGTLRLTADGSFHSGDCYDQAAGPLLYALACPPDLWTSDATVEGTRIVTGAIPGDPGQDILIPAPLGGGIAFVAESDASRLFFTDGTQAGTRLVRELESVGFDRPQPLGGRLVLGAGDPALGREPWITDGTPEGTAPLHDVRPGPADSSPSSFAPMGPHVLFRANDGEHGAELWMTDGTPEGTRLVRDIQPGSESSTFLLSPAASSGAAAWLVASRGAESRVWRTDGTEAGTVPVGPVFMGGANRPHELTLSGGLLFFAAGPDLWVSDGTGAGTRSVRSFDRPARALIDVGGIVVFAAAESRPPLAPRDTLWRSDGTTDGTASLQEITPVSWQFDADREVCFVRAQRRTYFVGNDGVRGEEIWSAWTSVLAGDRPAALRDLRDEAASLDLPVGLARALQAALSAADTPAGLKPFIQHVEALQGKAIPEAAARVLLDLAADIEGMKPPP